MKRTLIVLHAYFTLMTIATWVLSFFDLFDVPILMSPADVPDLLANPTLVLATTLYSQFSNLFTLPPTYYLFAFARLIFYGEEEKGNKIEKLIMGVIALALAIEFVAMGLLLYEIVCSLTGVTIKYVLVSLSVLRLDLAVVFLNLGFVCLVTIPIFFISFHFWKRIARDNPHKPDLLYLAVMVSIIFLMPIFRLLDIVFLQGGASYPTIAIILFWVCTPVIFYTAYRGFFASKPKKQEVRSSTSN